MSKNEGKSFWYSLSGVLTAVAALITAIGGLIAIFQHYPDPVRGFPRQNRQQLRNPQPLQSPSTRALQIY